MARVTIEDCTKIVPSRFKLVIIAAHRAKALIGGAKSRLIANDKPTVKALKEIAEHCIDPVKVWENKLQQAKLKHVNNKDNAVIFDLDEESELLDQLSEGVYEPKQIQDNFVEVDDQE